METPLTETKTKLKQLDAQIKQTKQTLAMAQDKHEILHKALAENEKEISAGVRHLRKIEQDIFANQQLIKAVEERVDSLKRQLKAQQHLLAEHVRIRYKMGEYQPLKWLLNQDNPLTISRLLTFHQYIVETRQNIIAEIDTTCKSLTVNQENLKNLLHAQEQSKQNLNTHQQVLEGSKQQHKTLLESLTHAIQTNQLTLSEYERNKENLSHLLEQLASQSILQSKKPFIQMRKKLPNPVPGRQGLQKMNQGVTFFAVEGTPVTAVYTGKVVFSDWLKGYGLLLIVDHGQGYMTLYAHNQSLFKLKGSTVMQGEQIAAVGHSGGLRQNGLYFEVRHRGKAIPPLEWLA